MLVEWIYEKTCPSPSIFHKAYSALGNILDCEICSEKNIKL